MDVSSFSWWKDLNDAEQRYSAVPAASSEDALAHFERRLTFETDCWDVHDALSRGEDDFVGVGCTESGVVRKRSCSGCYKSAACQDS